MQGEFRMKYGYGRVSTHGQYKRGWSADEQKRQLKEQGVEIVYLDISTGKRQDRTALQALLSVVQPGDTVYVTRLDRLSRSVQGGIQTIQGLLDKQVSVHVLNMGLIDNSSMGSLIVNIMLAFAQYELDLIVERTQEGKHYARLRGKLKEGRPRKFSSDQIKHAMELLEDNSYGQVSRLTGISVSTLKRAKRVASVQQ